MITRRDALKAMGGFFATGFARPGAGSPAVTIQDVEIRRGVIIQADNGTRGSFAGSSSQDLKSLQPHWGRIRELLIGKDPFDPSLGGELLWESIYPGKAKLYAEGHDPLTGESIANKARDGRQTKTGQVFMAFSTVDIALWDLRARQSFPGSPVCGLCAVGPRLVWRPRQSCYRSRRLAQKPRVSPPSTVRLAPVR